MNRDDFGPHEFGRLIAAVLTVILLAVVCVGFVIGLLAVAS